MVALAALLTCVGCGLVPAAEAFFGFGHPAVITVACVLLLGHGLQLTGAADAADAVAQRLLPNSTEPSVTILALIGLAALLFGFMNNVGALAPLMPLAGLVVVGLIGWRMVPKRQPAGGGSSFPGSI